MFDLVPPPLEKESELASLAKQHAPILYFDKLEPFLPSAVAFTVFTAETKEFKSPSFKRNISLEEGVSTVIEYAIWWDWDIQHLYELEHLWVYLNEQGNLIRTEASFHGDFHDLETQASETPQEQGRAVAYSEPGKHAFAGYAEQLKKLRPINQELCTNFAGQGDVLVNHMFKGKIQTTPLNRRLATRYMQACAFSPSYNFNQRFDLKDVAFFNWTDLEEWIPKRVNSWLTQLELKLPYLKAVCLDSGDTIIDEGTEQKDAEGIVLAAELIPTADSMMENLVSQGYELALVADGDVESFENVLGAHGFYDVFFTRAISESVGVLKPHAPMFLTALEALDLKASDHGHTVMVGNNLGRDIKGANDLGMLSVWLDWAPRRSKTPNDKSEEPNYTIKKPQELLETLKQIEIDFATQYLSTVSDTVEDKTV